MPDLHAMIVPVTSFQQNCLLMWSEASKRGSVFDPGGDAPKVFGAIEKAGFAVDSILLTHGHLDHAGAAMALQALLKAAGQEVPIIGPDKRDQFLLDTIAGVAAQFGVAGLENCTPDRWLSEGEQVSVAGETFEVLHCPGHTPGHLVFVAAAVPLAVVGDVLFQGSVGRTDFAYGDHAMLLRSIADKLLPLADDMRFFCGHGPGSTIGAERRGNPFLAEIVRETDRARGV